MERVGVIRNLLQAVDQFNDRQLWERFTNSDCFAIKLPGQNHPMLAVILGDGGEEYGLTFFRGPNAASCLAELLELEEVGDDAMEDADLLGFSTDLFINLPPDSQVLLRNAGQHPSYDEPAPNFLAKPPGCQGRLPDDSEFYALLLALRGVVAADKKKLLQPGPLEEEEGICVLELGDDPRSPLVSVKRERWNYQELPKTIPLLFADFDLANLPRLEATWLVGLPAIPAQIEGDDRAMRLLLVVDDAKDLVLQGRPVFSGEIRETAEDLVDVFHGKGLIGIKGLPQSIVFSSRKLFEAMTPVLERHGVKCVYSATIDKLDELVEQFCDLCDGLPFQDDEAVEAGQCQVPEDNDLAGWKEADHRLSQRFMEHLDFEDRLWSSRPVKRYFGDDDLEYFLEEHAEQGVAMSYAAWGVLDYRPTKRSKTEAEKMLEQGLPEPEAILLRARMEAHPTLYRVDSHDPRAGTVGLEDVLLGGKVIVHDQLMSENILNGLFVAARTFPAGAFHFLELAGPPLGMGMGMDAVHYLEYSGLEFTREGLLRDAHKLGWLWDWIDQWQANWRPPKLRNTDGEDLLWHTASFTVNDQSNIRQMLLSREDIEYDEHEDEFIWLKKAGEDSGMLGGPITLGGIELVGDELVLTVNSAGRFAVGRKWLEQLPGVEFCNVETRNLAEFDSDRPLDERISKPEPVEITPEIAASIQEMIDKQYTEWIDTPLPVLGHKTPREACQTKAGRQQVTTLIRTIPDPMGQAAVRVPREAMLRELGLSTESSEPLGSSLHVPEAPIPIETVDSFAKIGRNDPCPCGSGKKYKKCCGRQDSPARSPGSS